MKKIIGNIEDIYGHYCLDYLNCFEHPMAIMYRHTLFNSEKLFLIWIKMNSVFGERMKSLELSDNSSEIGVRCKYKEIHDNLIESIKSLLKKDIPVAVPCNLITIFYSKLYKERDWGHLMLVKGFDDSKQVFYILDHTQIPDDGLTCCYHEFAIKYEDLQESFLRYRGYNEGRIFYLEKADDKNTFIERTIAVLKKLYENIKQKNNIERNIIQLARQIESQGKKIDSRDKLLYQNLITNVPKFKKVILNEMISIMKSKSYSCEKLQEITENLVGSWTTDNMVFMRDIFRDKLQKLEYDYSEKTTYYEEQLLIELERCIQFLQNYECKDCDMECEILCENNTDELIHYCNGNYVFQIETGKIYNSWLDDKCPKVILYQGNEQQNEDILIRTKIRVEKEAGTQGHNEGIYIRTEKDELYMFGIDYNRIVSFDLVGIGNVAIYDVEWEAMEIELEIIQRNNQIITAIVSEKNEVMELGSYDMESKIAQAGIYCKNYDLCDKVVVTFSNTEVNVTKNI